MYSGLVAALAKTPATTSAPPSVVARAPTLARALAPSAAPTLAQALAWGGSSAPAPTSAPGSTFAPTPVPALAPVRAAALAQTTTSAPAPTSAPGLTFSPAPMPDLTLVRSVAPVPALFPASAPVQPPAPLSAASPTLLERLRAQGLLVRGLSPAARPAFSLLMSQLAGALSAPPSAAGPPRPPQPAGPSRSPQAPQQASAPRPPPALQPVRAPMTVPNSAATPTRPPLARPPAAARPPMSVPQPGEVLRSLLMAAPVQLAGPSRPLAPRTTQSGPLAGGPLVELVAGGSRITESELAPDGQVRTSRRFWCELCQCSVSWGSRSHHRAAHQGRTTCSGCGKVCASIYQRKLHEPLCPALVALGGASEPGRSGGSPSPVASEGDTPPPHDALSDIHMQIEVKQEPKLDPEDVDEPAAALGGLAVPPYRPLLVEGGYGGTASGGESPAAGMDGKMERTDLQEDTKTAIIQMLGAEGNTTDEQRDTAQVTDVSLEVTGMSQSMITPATSGGQGSGGVRRESQAVQDSEMIPFVTVAEPAGPAAQPPVDVFGDGHFQAALGGVEGGASGPAVEVNQDPVPAVRGSRQR